MKRFLFGAATAVMLGSEATPVLAEYPALPISMVIPYCPGSATDISARTLAAPLGKFSLKLLLMVNKTGAGGATGSVAVKFANADGYTLLFARVGSHSVNPAMKATLPYTLDDFRFVGVYEPTILANVTTDMDGARNEIFGPIAPIIVFEDEADAIAFANDTEFGLASYLYTRDLGRAWRVSDALDYGMVGINEVAIPTR